MWFWSMRRMMALVGCVAKMRPLKAPPCSSKDSTGRNEGSVCVVCVCAYLSRALMG